MSPPALPTRLQRWRQRLRPPGGDATDSLTPELVKDVRRGLRSLYYVIAFIVLQVGLAITTAMTRTEFSQFIDPFWAFLSFVIGILLPFCAAVNLWKERKESKLELLIMAGLGGRQILYGKWLCIVAYMCLVASAAMPYLVLRYFLGSDLLHEIGQMIGLVCNSALRAGFALWIVSLRGRNWVWPIGLFCLVWSLGMDTVWASAASLAKAGGGFSHAHGVSSVALYFLIIATLPLITFPAVYAVMNLATEQLTTRFLKMTSFDAFMLVFAIIGAPILKALIGFGLARPELSVDWCTPPALLGAVVITGMMGRPLEPHWVHPRDDLHTTPYKPGLPPGA